MWNKQKGYCKSSTENYMEYKEIVAYFKSLNRVFTVCTTHYNIQYPQISLT
jgi:hypothetical protein